MSLFEKCGDSALIAKKLGLSRSRVNRIIADYRAKHGLPKETMYASGVSDAALLRAHDETGQDVALTAKAVGLSYSQVHRRLTRIRLAGGSSARPHVFEADPASDKPNRVDGVRERAGVPLDAIRRVTGGTLREWGVAIKNKDGEFEEHGLYGTTLKFTVDTPEFPLIQPATPTKIVYKDAPRILRKVGFKIVLSDMQMGYLRDVESGQLEPTHDPRAMEVARQVIADTQPSQIIGIGDRVDWPIFSRWQKRPEFFAVTQPSVQAAYEWAARFIAAAPKGCESIEIPSNHQMRPETFILEYNREAVGLTRARRPGDKGPEWPVFSEPFLLRYDELGIKLTGQYPGGEFYIFPDLVAMHAPPKAKEFSASCLHGHLHRLTMTTSAVHGYEGRRNYHIFDTGCLCQVDSTSNKRRLLVTRVPSDRARTDWAQGIAAVEYIEGKQPKWQVHLIRITDGEALFAGQAYSVPRDFDEKISCPERPQTNGSKKVARG